ncbi:hypothetical protein Tco_1030398 [Tanacetum coccineum]|uniref:Uncharacterized protein n=1 Tax=Tanacetum coccineum TaxID=301880 RepID=A0ABQ5G7Y1_9ASTR
MVSSHPVFPPLTGCDRLVSEPRMSTIVLVDPESSTPGRTDTESEPFEDLGTESPESPHVVASPISFPDSTPPVGHVEESEGSGTSSAGSTSSDSTTPLSPDHPLTRDTPVLVPSLRRTARMAVRVQPVLSPGYSAHIAEATSMSDVAFHKRFRSSYESSPSPSPTLLVRKRYREDEGPAAGDEDLGLDDKGYGLDDESHGIDNKGHSVKKDGLGLEEEDEAVPKGQQQAAPVVETTVGEPLGLGYGALRRRELAAEEDQRYSTFEVGQVFGSAPEPERSERVSAFRQPALTTWTDPEDGTVYIDVPTYPPSAPPVQTPPSPDWTPGSLPISPSHSDVPSPVSSPLISLTVPSPVATPTATIPVDEDQFIEVGAQLELYGSILQDHTQRLDAMPPTLFAEIDRDVRELYTRSGAVRDEIFSQRYRLRSLEQEQERAVMTFGALWRPVLALETWAGHVDTRMANMSRAGYDDHRLVHDLLVQQTSLQHELQEMRGRVTALEQERDRGEQ